MPRIRTIEATTINVERIPYRFCPVPTELLQDPRVSVENKGMMAVLLCYSRPQKGRYVVWPGVDALAEICGCSKRAVSRMLKSLEKANLITRTRRLGTSSLTTLTRMPTYGKDEPVITEVEEPNITDLLCKVDVVEEDVVTSTKRESGTAASRTPSGVECSEEPLTSELPY